MSFDPKKFNFSSTELLAPKRSLTTIDGDLVIYI